MDLRAVLKQLKFGLCTYPQLKDNGALANNTYFDTQGLSSILFLITIGAIDIGFGSTASDTKPLVEECDTTGGSYTAVTGAQLSACPGASDDGKMYGIFVDLTKSHKRYMQVQAPTAGDGTAGVAAAIVAIGFPADQGPKSASEMGLAELISA